MAIDRIGQIVGSVRGSVVAAFAVLCSPLMIVAQGGDPVSIDDPDAYLVYRAVLGTSRSEIVVRQQTIVNPTCSAGGEAFEHDWREVLAAYLTDNARTWMLRAEPLRATSLRVVPGETLSQSFGPDFWRAFPDGYVRVSAIGFDTARTRALVYVERVSRTGTRGTSAALEKVNGVWVLASRTDIDPCTMIVD
jgi:hypothetical protein